MLSGNFIMYGCADVAFLLTPFPAASLPSPLASLPTGKSYYIAVPIIVLLLFTITGNII